MSKVVVTVDRQALARLMNQSGPFQSYLDQKAKEVADRARANMPTATGKLKESIHIDSTSRTVAGGPSVPGIVAHGRTVSVNSEHAEAVETGTGPKHESLNRTPEPHEPYRRLPPADRIIEWAREVGLTDQEIAENVQGSRGGGFNLYGLRRYIQLHGTPARHYMFDALRSTFIGARGDFGSRT